MAIDSKISKYLMDESIGNADGTLGSEAKIIIDCVVTPKIQKGSPSNEAMKYLKQNKNKIINALKSINGITEISMEFETYGD